MKKIVEYLGTGPNPIEVPALRGEPLNKGGRAEAEEAIALQLEAQGLFKIVGDVEAAPAESPTPAPLADAPAASASVPFVITKKMQTELKARGFTQDDVDKMTPEEAQKALA